MSEMNNENNRIYLLDESQKVIFEKEIDLSFKELQKIFDKEEILKYLYKNIEDGKYEFNKDEEKDKFCREIKEIFDIIKPEIFQKYNRRIASAAIKIMKAIYKRREFISNPLRKIKVKNITSESDENKNKYNNLNQLKELIKEVIDISSIFNQELVNSYETFSQNLNDFYNDRNNVELIKNINGEDKKANDDDLIKKVVYLKENKGEEFILDTKNFINKNINEQMNLNEKIKESIEEINNIKEQQKILEKYYNNENSDLRILNEIDFYA